MAIYRILLAVVYVIVPIYAQKYCSIKLEKYQDFVKLNQTALVKCSSNCTGISWETRLAKLNITVSGNSSTLEVKIDDWDDSPIQCLVEPGDEIVARAKINVLPYVLPSKVDIELKEELEEDKEHNVTCSAYEVAPLEHAVLSVTRGGEVFLSKTFEYTKLPQNLKETFTFRANRNDNYKNFSCQVTLNLTNVANTTVQSSAVTVRTYAFPEDPRITAKEWIEHGSVTTISCEVPNTFPQAETITELLVKGLNYTQSIGNEAVSFTLNTSDLFTAQNNVLCKSMVYNTQKQSDMWIFIYERPNVNFTVSRKVVDLGDTVTVDCHLIEGNSEYFTLSIYVDGELAHTGAAPVLTANVTIRQRKPEIPVTCETVISRNNEVVLKAEEILTVHYPPEFDNCPETFVFDEGSQYTFNCLSTGNPTPVVQCSSSTLFLNSSARFIAERIMSGSYECLASNAKNSIQKDVNVIVQYQPSVPIVNTSTPSAINVRDSINLTCYSDAVPAPTYNWTIPAYAKVEYSQDRSSIIIREASSHHKGTYTCHVKNGVGQSQTTQDLDVKSDYTTIRIIVGVTVGVVAVAVTIAVACYFISQIKKKGFYNLLRRTPGSSDSSELPLQDTTCKA